MKNEGINIADLINHILPPPPEPVTKAAHEVSTITNRVVTIPVVNKVVEHEIHSPIFKNKRKRQEMEKKSGKGGFGIQLNAV